MTLQLEGRATVTSSEQRERYGHAYLEQFPGARALDEGFVVSITPKWLRIHDTTTEPADVVEHRWV